MLQAYIGPDRRAYSYGGCRTASDITNTIQARYEKLRTFSATFEQTLTHKESGSVEKRQGSLLFQKPLLIRWQTDKPHEETLVVTNKEIWDYLGGRRNCLPLSLELVRDSRTIIQVITGRGRADQGF